MENIVTRRASWSRTSKREATKEIERGKEREREIYLWTEREEKRDR